MKKDVKWLKELMEVELRSVRQAVDKVEATNKEAVDKVEKNNENYRATQNEWRQQLKDQTGSFVTRRELLGAVITIVTLIISAIAILVKK